MNQFSICDILGSIEKQLIFSTHDLSFAKLFLKKNEYKTERMQLLNLKGYYLDKSKIEFLEI